MGRPSPRADPGGAARLTAVIEAATSTYLSALDDDVNSLGTAGIACQKPDHCIPGTSQLRLPRGRQRRHGLLSAFRSHFGSSHVHLERAYDFLCHELFWFCLVQVSTTQFCSFPSFLMARASDGTDVPVSPFPASSSNIGSPSGSLPDFEGTGIRPSAMEWKIKGMFVQVAKLPLRTQSVSRFEICVQTLAQTVASYDAKITNMERIVSSLAARASTLQTNAASDSSGSGSASSWNLLGHSDGSTATGSLGSHGPGSSDDNRNARRRLDTFSSPEDEHARSAVLLQFPSEQYHAGVSTWFEKFWGTTNASFSKPTRIHCKTGSMSARLVFETRAKSQDFVAARMMVSLMRLIAHFAIPVPISLSANPNRLKIEKLEDDLRLFGESCPPNYKTISLNEMPKTFSLFLHLTHVHKSSAFWIAGTEWRNQFSSLHIPDTNSRLILLLLTYVFQTFLMMSCDMSFAKPTSRFRTVRPMCDGHSFASSPFRHLASRGPPFRGFPSWWVKQFAISLARCLALQDSAPRYREGSQYEFGRLHDTLSCLFYTALRLGPVSIHCDADMTTRGY